MWRVSIVLVFFCPGRLAVVNLLCCRCLFWFVFSVRWTCAAGSIPVGFFLGGTRPVLVDLGTISSAGQKMGFRNF